ncbi:hypothetical protein [Burkholderia sp. 22313]|uniref:hypothetical protein n=1 Tax=Burkholderia sp. 22313 TaxID=3453908 RepID=UPI003F82C00D
METPFDVEGAVSRRLDRVDDHSAPGAQPSTRTAPGSGASFPCIANIPALTPHEIATLMLVAHRSEQVSTEWRDLLSLLNHHLVWIDKCLKCQGKPRVTPLGENLVGRLRQTTSRAPKDASSNLDPNRDHH